MGARRPRKEWTGVLKTPIIDGRCIVFQSLRVCGQSDIVGDFWLHFGPDFGAFGVSLGPVWVVLDTKVSSGPFFCQIFLDSFFHWILGDVDGIILMGGRQ